MQWYHIFGVRNSMKYSMLDSVIFGKTWNDIILYASAFSTKYNKSISNSIDTEFKNVMKQELMN